MARPSTPRWLLGLVCLVSLGARLFHLDQPGEHGHEKGFVFDEKYYVNAARVIARVSFPTDDTYNGSSPAGTDPNGEHPQLGKLVIAAGIRLFGDNGLGWRAGAVIFGTLAILALYWLVREVGGSSWLALGAASLMAFENLEMVHGRIGVLDVFCLPFMLAAVALYLRGNPLLAGLSIGIGTATKLFGAYALLAVVLLEGLRAASWGATRLRERRHARAAAAREPDPGTTTPDPVATATAPDPHAAGAMTAPLDGGRRPGGRRLPRWARLPVCVVTAVMATLVVLGTCDHFVPAWSGGHQISADLRPWTHLSFIYDYGKNLRSPDGPKGIASYPWQFWVDVEGANYYTFNQFLLVGTKTTQINTVIAYQGLVNPVLLAMWPLALVSSVWLAVRRRDDLSFLVIAWTLATWLPPLVAWEVDKRTVYLYYMVVILPGVIIGTARVLAHRLVPRLVLGIWVGLFAAAFCVLYPFRDWASVTDWLHIG